MANIQLAKNLLTLRKSHKLTQEYISSHLSISRQAYSNYETSKRTPDLESLIKLSQLYSISLDQLVNDYLGSELSESKGPYNLGLNITNGDTLYLTESEVKLLMNFRTLSIDEQKVIQGFLDSKSN